MTPSEMLTLLGYRLEDPNGDVYTTALKVLMINRAQARVYTELNPHVVPELQNKESDLALDENGAFDTSALTGTVLGGISGGVFDVEESANNYFTNLISFDEYRISVDRSYTFAQSSPRRYILGKKQYYLPSSSTAMTMTAGDSFVVGKKYAIMTYVTGDDFTNIGGTNVTGNTFVATGTSATTFDSSTVSLISFTAGNYYYVKTFAGTDDFTNIGGANASDSRFKATGALATEFLASTLYETSGVNVYYKKQPTQITVADYATESFTVESEQVQDAVTYFAESLCWAVNNDPREEKAAGQAANMIQTLNETIVATDSNMRDDEHLDDNYSVIEPISAWEV